MWSELKAVVNAIKNIPLRIEPSTSEEIEKAHPPGEVQMGADKRG